MASVQPTTEWTPTPGVLFALAETATDIAYTISASVSAPPTGGAGGQGDQGGNPGGGAPAPTITGYSADITPAQTIIDTSADHDSISVTADNLSGLFPISGITYRQGDEIHTVQDWGDLPADCDIIAFKPGSDRSRSYTLAATAHLSDDTAATADYAMTVQHDWSAGRTALKEAVNARR